MKKVLFTLVLSATLLFASAQQLDREFVLMEVGTATWCGPCNTAANAMNQLDQNGFPVIYVKYQASDGQWSNPHSNVRLNYYGVSGIPQANIDGLYSHVGSGNAYNVYANYINARLDTPTSFTLNIFGEYDDGSGNIVVKVDQLGPNDDNLKVYISVTETVAHAWQGQTHIKDMNRWMIPDAYGTVITISEGETALVEHDFNIQANWQDENIKLVAWVQNDANKEVHVVNAVELLNLEPYSILESDFYAEETEVCPETVIEFVDNSIGDVIVEWLWDFGDGNTSTEKDPQHTYEQPGMYDVSLTVTDSDGHQATTSKEDYITVYENPEVSFEGVPVLCVFWDPYELTEGMPEGGEYSGEGVVDGHFHPQTTGMGMFEVTYAYTDENGCSAEAVYSIEVDACTAVDELHEQLGLQVQPNPSAGKVAIKLDHNPAAGAYIKIMNSIGNVVYTQKLMHTSRNFDLDLSGLAEGVYLLQYHDGKAILNQRIILQ